MGPEWLIRAAEPSDLPAWYFTSATNAASIAMHARLGFAEVTVTSPSQG